MDINVTWRIFCMGLWMVAGWMDVLGQRTTADVGQIPYLSKKDVSLLVNDADPKCFTRTYYDFTCFWETSGNTSYDFFYRHDDREEEKRCNLILQRTEEKEESTVLHVCFLPGSDVLLYIDIHIRVVDRSTNYTVYSRTVNIEDQVLLDAPVNVSLHQTGRHGQVQVVWHKQSNVGESMQIRYSSHSMKETTNLIISESRKSLVYTLVSLVPGEVISVQLRVKHSGHWSDWSAPVAARVPQCAEDISLLCHSSDLQNITCKWHGQASSDTYNLFYRLGSSEKEGWRKCLLANNTNRCSFHGVESNEIQVKLSSGPTTLSQTFYTEPFTINKIIQTGPPGWLRGQLEGGRLLLTWDCPMVVLSVHLTYELRYQPAGESSWKSILLGPETTTYLDIQNGGQYIVQVRAKPNNIVYSGNWSNWSAALTVDIPSNLGAVVMTAIPLMMVILSVPLFAMFFGKIRPKLKQYLWPPVPNLDKVLHGFLTDINGQTWDPPLNIKQCSEEMTACLVEIISEGEAPSGAKHSREYSVLLSPERGTLHGEDRNPPQVLEVNPDYVTLTTEHVLPCLQGNTYVFDGEVGWESPCLDLGRQEGLQILSQGSTSKSSSFPASSSTTDIVNQSYLLLAEQPIERQKGLSRVYANLDGTSSQTQMPDGYSGKTHSGQ
ncbi:hypothetical protein UPYG_G00032590 [Umbra pygmaea]|uniref:Fibronectin type-III domain-containing protein n=1 Tax=Umbra pygmaea TaxID=75934 RepID=A0ABD0XN44_UMBPY